MKKRSIIHKTFIDILGNLKTVEFLTKNKTQISQNRVEKKVFIQYFLFNVLNSFLVKFLLTFEMFSRLSSQEFRLVPT